MSRILRRYTDHDSVFYLTKGWKSRHHAVVDTESHDIIRMRDGFRYNIYTGSNAHGFKSWATCSSVRSPNVFRLVLSVAYLPTRRAALEQCRTAFFQEFGHE